MNLTNTDFTTKFLSSMSLTTESVVNREHIITSDDPELNGKKFFSQTVSPRTSPYSHGLGVTTYFLEGLDKEFKTPIDVVKFLKSLG